MIQLSVHYRFKKKKKNLKLINIFLKRLTLSKCWSWVLGFSGLLNSNAKLWDSSLYPYLIAQSGQLDCQMGHLLFNGAWMTPVVHKNASAKDSPLLHSLQGILIIFVFRKCWCNLNILAPSPHCTIKSYKHPGRSLC